MQGRVGYQDTKVWKSDRRLVGRTPWSAADPLVGRFSLRIPLFPGDYSGMTLSRRRLPHIYATERSVFLTWRLDDSLPPHRAFPAAMLNSGQAFAAMDRLL